MYSVITDFIFFVINQSYFSVIFLFESSLIKNIFNFLRAGSGSLFP